MSFLHADEDDGVDDDECGVVKEDDEDSVPIVLRLTMQ
jgi:hypothetical protein